MTSRVETPTLETATTATPATPPVGEAAGATPTAPAPTGREADGRFAEGNPGGPGNPFARQVAALKREFLTAAKERLPKILDKLLGLAEEGNLAAIKLVLQYTYGKPTQPPNPDRLDIEEWRQFKEEAGMMQELPGLVAKPEPILPLTAVRGARPEVTAGMAQMMGAMCRDPEGFFAEHDQAQEKEFRRQERAALRHHHAKYGDVPPDESGLPPGVRPLQPKDNGQNGRKRGDRAGAGGSPLANARIGEPPRVCQHPPRAERKPGPITNGKNGRS